MTLQEFFLISSVVCAAPHVPRLIGSVLSLVALVVSFIV